MSGRRRSRLESELSRRLAQLSAEDLYRRRRLVTGPHGARISVDGQHCLNFSSNDYLGLAGHPVLVAAMRRAAESSGSGSGASQLITGHNREHQALEQELADFLGCARALYFSTGYAANVGIIDALVGRGDWIVADALNHASLIDGARLSGANKQIYPHADLAQARTALRRADGGQRLLLSDSVFSMDGDCAPLALLRQLAGEQGAWLMVDDAHGFGVLGDGRGAFSGAAPGISDAAATRLPDVYIATLGKSAGAAGAFVAGSEMLIEYLLQRARSYVFSTAPPPAVAAAARAGLGLLREEHWRREHLRGLITRFRQGASQLDLPLLPSQTPIQPLILGEPARALEVSQALLARGFLVGAIRPPTVAPGTARLRITLTAAHDEQQVDRLLDALAQTAAPVAERPALIENE